MSFLRVPFNPQNVVFWTFCCSTTSRTPGNDSMRLKISQRWRTLSQTRRVSFREFCIACIRPSLEMSSCEQQCKSDATGIVLNSWLFCNEVGWRFPTIVGFRQHPDEKPRFFRLWWRHSDEHSTSRTYSGSAVPQSRRRKRCYLGGRTRLKQMFVNTEGTNLGFKGRAWDSQLSSRTGGS